RRAVPWPLVEHAADMGGERDVLQHRLGEDLLAALHVGVGIGAAGGGEVDVAAADMGKAQQLQRLDQREQFVDRQVLFVGEVRQVGMAVERRFGQAVDKT